MKFTYSTQLNALSPYDDAKPVETFKGEIEADNHHEAREKVQKLAWNRCKQLERESGVTVGYNPNAVQVTFLKDEPSALSQDGSRMTITPQDYQQHALRTLYPDLTTNERLGLCGLGLPGEIGEVVDLIKKYLYHRNGKALDTEKLKDELGDVLWYFFILLDTLGLTFEEVMQANVAKLELRHGSGFNPRYQSDSHASEGNSHEHA